VQEILVDGREFVLELGLQMADDLGVALHGGLLKGSKKGAAAAKLQAYSTGRRMVACAGKTLRSLH
jgi:hypothetical protein